MDRDTEGVAGALEKHERFLKRIPRAALRSKHVCISPALGASSLGESASRLQEELSEASCRGTARKEWTSPRRGWRREKQNVLEG